jgi:Ca2+-binding RTX toxin-like protein
MPIGRIGQDFVVNTTAAGNQFSPTLAALADGRFVATWQSYDTGDGSGNCIRARLYNTDGSPAGDDFIVNSTTMGGQDDPSVTALADGRFVVTWASTDGGDGSGTCVRARVFNGGGSAVGHDFIVNSTTTNNQYAPSVTALADGRFVATWTSEDTGDGSGDCIRARVLNGDGTAAGNDFLVNTTITNNQSNPSVTALADGRFVMTWRSDDSGDGSGSCIRARIYSAGGSAVGNDFIVDSTTSGNQDNASVTALADGRFVVTWASADTGDGDGTCVRARVFNGNGSAAGDDFIVDSTAVNDQRFPSVTALADGRFVATWMSDDTGDGSGSCIRGRVYNADGSAAGNDFIVNTTATGQQFGSSVTALADGRFVVTWYSFDSGDGSGSCIRAQLFDPTVFVGTAGEDTWQGGSFADRINGGASADTLSGLGGNDVISGDAGNDTLIGGSGNDTLFGGIDSDTYWVDSAGDRVLEVAGQGLDTVIATASYALAAGVSVEVLRTAGSAGTAAINLTGNAFEQTLQGNAAANVLNGGGGADTMQGFGGNDTYVVDNAGDIVSETGGSGTDTVVSSMSFDLSNTGRVFGAVERLTLAGASAINGTGDAFANVIVGNAAANIINGLAGDDTINGLGGADLMIGGSGNDTFHVDNGSDRVNDTSGIDAIISSVTYSLADTVRVVGTIENMTLTGSAALGIGNAAANVLKGNAVANDLRGMDGNDTLHGYAGNDTLRGGLGNDVFVFDTTPNATTNRDVIADFANVSGNNDLFRLENTFFTKLAAGALNPANFKVGAAAGDANDYIVYNQATGALYYDVNGNGGGGAIHFATLSNKVALTASDFQVI